MSLAQGYDDVIFPDTAVKFAAGESRSEAWESGNIEHESHGHIDFYYIYLPIYGEQCGGYIFPFIYVS